MGDETVKNEWDAVNVAFRCGFLLRHSGSSGHSYGK